MVASSFPANKSVLAGAASRFPLTCLFRFGGVVMDPCFITSENTVQKNPPLPPHSKSGGCHKHLDDHIFVLG